MVSLESKNSIHSLKCDADLLSLKFARIRDTPEKVQSLFKQFITDAVVKVETGECPKEPVVEILQEFQNELSVIQQTKFSSEEMQSFQTQCQDTIQKIKKISDLPLSFPALITYIKTLHALGKQENKPESVAGEFTRDSVHRKLEQTFDFAVALTLDDIEDRRKAMEANFYSKDKLKDEVQDLLERLAPHSDLARSKLLSLLKSGDDISYDELKNHYRETLNMCKTSDQFQKEFLEFKNFTHYFSDFDISLPLLYISKFLTTQPLAKQRTYLEQLFASISRMRKELPSGLKDQDCLVVINEFIKAFVEVPRSLVYETDFLKMCEEFGTYIPNAAKLSIKEDVDQIVTETFNSIEKRMQKMLLEKDLIARDRDSFKKIHIDKVLQDIEVLKERAKDASPELKEQLLKDIKDLENKIKGAQVDLKALLVEKRTLTDLLLYFLISNAPHDNRLKMASRTSNLIVQSLLQNVLKIEDISSILTDFFSTLQDKDQIKYLHHFVCILAKKCYQDKTLFPNFSQIVGEINRGYIFILEKRCQANGRYYTLDITQELSEFNRFLRGLESPLQHKPWTPSYKAKHVAVSYDDVTVMQVMEDGIHISRQVPPPPPPKKGKIKGLFKRGKNPNP